MKKEIRVLVVEPMRKPYVKTIPDTLEAIYQVIVCRLFPYTA